MKDNVLIELIYTMIDGEASEVERQTLFNALQQNPELQMEFQNAMNINNAGKSFVSSSEVPSHLTNQLFNKSGMVYTGSLKKVSDFSSVSNKVAANRGLFHGLGKFAFGKYGFGILGLVIGGLLSIVFYVNSDIGSRNTYNNMASNKDLKNANVASFNAGSIEKPEIKNVPNADKDNNKVIIKYVSRDNDIPANKNTTINDKSSISSADNEIANYENTKDELNFTISDIQNTANNLGKINNTIQNSFFNLPGNDFDNTFDLFNSEERDKNFQFEINNSLYWNLPKETVSPEEISKFHNLNIFLYYLINNYFSFGIGVRQETFYVKYNTNDELFRDFIYEQQPNLTNYELSVRIIPYEFEIYKPFLQLNFGGGKFGYTYRAGIGNRIKLYDELALTFLLEYAMLNYQHKTEMYKANKIGLNYGINYNF